MFFLGEILHGGGVSKRLDLCDNSKLTKLHSRSQESDLDLFSDLRRERELLCFVRGVFGSSERIDEAEEIDRILGDVLRWQKSDVDERILKSNASVVFILDVEEDEVCEKEKKRKEDEGLTWPTLDNVLWLYFANNERI